MKVLLNVSPCILELPALTIKLFDDIKEKKKKELARIKIE